jgi:small-conductance mechanosensitive channel
MELRTWIERAPDKYRALAWLNMSIWRAFKDQEIQIPFPQMDLHVKALPQTDRA